MFLNISIEYDEDKKELFIAEESASGCTYQHIEKKDIPDYIKDYVFNYFEED